MSLTRSDPLVVHSGRLVRTPSRFGERYGVQLFPGLNNILVPRGAFLSSPLGQAILNTTVVSTGVTRGPLQYFVGNTWITRTQSRSPGQGDYVQVISSTDMSCGSGPARACQGLASNSALEAGNQARQVQSILTFNVSSQTELDSVLGGLLLNASGNVTGSLLNVSAELPTLGLSSNVLDALANRALPNVGAFGEPSSTFTPPPPPCSGNQCLWNAVSGVIHIALGIFSVAWNAAVAAATYFAQVAAAVSNALGISGLVNQLANTLKAVGAAMERALRALVAALVQAVAAFVRPALAPIQNQAKAELAALSQAFTLANTTGLASSLQSWATALIPVLLIGIALSVVAFIASEALTPEESVLGPVAVLVFGIVVVALGLTTGIGGAIATGLSGLGSPSALIAAVTRAVVSFFDPQTCSSVVAGEVAVFVGGAFAVFSLMISLLTYKFLGADGIVAAGAGLSFAAILVASILVFVSGLSPQSVGVVAGVAAFLAVLGIIVDIVGLGQSVLSGWPPKGQSFTKEDIGAIVVADLTLLLDVSGLLIVGNGVSEAHC